MSSVSHTFLDLIPTFTPTGDRHQDSVNLFGVTQVTNAVHKIGWIDHTSDWDIVHEITVGEVTHLSQDITLLANDGNEFNDEEYIRDDYFIEKIRLDDTNAYPIDPYEDNGDSTNMIIEVKDIKRLIITI